MVVDRNGCRYQTGQDLADDLKRWLHKEPIHARPVGRLERGVRDVVLLVTTGGFAAVTWQWRKARANQVQAQAVNGGQKT